MFYWWVRISFPLWSEERSTRSFLSFWGWKRLVSVNTGGRYTCIRVLMVSEMSRRWFHLWKKNQNTYATGLRTERKHLPSFVSSLVKHMHGRGIASSRRVIVLNLHFLRWSAMLAMLANFHSFTVPKAVLNLHTWLTNERESICYY